MHYRIIGKKTPGRADKWEFLKNGYIPMRAKSHIDEAQEGVFWCASVTTSRLMIICGVFDALSLLHSQLANF